METKITFEEYLRKENLSENTITSYLWTVNYFNVNYDVVSKENLLETTRIYLRRTASEQQELVDKIVTW